MTITIFVAPSSLIKFLEVTKILKDLPLENNYKFPHLDITFSESMISNYIWVNMDVEEFLRFKYSYMKLSKN